MNKNHLETRPTVSFAFGLMFVTVLPMWLFGQEPAIEKPVSKPSLALVHGNIMTMADESSSSSTIEDGRILIAGDKIVAIGGKELSIPEGVQQIDLTGCTVLPGLIDLQSRLWMSDSAADGGASDGSLQVIDSLNPFAEDWNEVIQQGVTTVYLQPSSRGAMSGLGAAVSVVPNEDGSLLIHSKAAGLQMSMGDFRSNRERQQRFESLKKSIQSVVDYKKSLDEYEQYLKKKKEEEEKAKAAQDKSKEPPKESQTKEPAPAPAVDNSKPRPPESTGRPSGIRRGPPGSETRPPFPPPQTPTPATPATVPPASGQGGPPSVAKPDATPKPPKKPEPDATKDRLLPVLAGKIPVRLEVHNANDVRFAVQLMDEFKKIQWILETVDDLQSAEPVIRQRRLPVILGPWLSLNSQLQSNTEHRKAWASLTNKYEGAIGIGSYSANARSSRLLREHASSAIASGVNRKVAIASMTSTAARLLGLSESLGSLSVGKRADIIAIGGDPMDTTAAVVCVISGGKLRHQSAHKPGILASKSESTIADFPAKLPLSYRLRSNRVLLQEEIGPATLTIVDGKFQAIEKTSSSGESSIPLIDLGDKMITPGLFSSYSTLGLEALTQNGSDSDSASMSATDFAIYGTSQQRSLQQSGIYAVAFATSPLNTFSGQIGVVPTHGKGTVLKENAAAQIVMSESARRNDRFPSSLVGQVKLVRELLDGKVTPSRLFIPSESLDRLSQSKQNISKQLLSKDQLSLFQVATDAEINAALSIIEQYKLRAALVGAKEWVSFLDRIKASNVAIIAKPVNDSDFQWNIDEFVSAQAQGVPVYFAGETAIQLRTTASHAVRAGMPALAALRALTLAPRLLYDTPAETMGLRTGSDANFIVWSDSPLNLESDPAALIVEGKLLREENESQHKVLRIGGKP